MTSTLPHRDKGYALLSGAGVEVGALYSPAILPKEAIVSYVDVVTKEQAIALFPELDQKMHKDFVDVDHIVDIEKEGFRKFKSNSLDFVVMNHVLEHVANPIFVIEECFRVLKTGGKAVIAIPDKRYTFDKNRAVTRLGHLWAEYFGGINEVTDAHYIDFLFGVYPEMVTLSADVLREHVSGVRQRREHVHVWDTQAWENLLDSVFSKLDIKARCCYKLSGDETHFEHFSVWQKY